MTPLPSTGMTKREGTGMTPKGATLDVTELDDKKGLSFFILFSCYYNILCSIKRGEQKHVRKRLKY
ncbi:hypothetical protein HET73_05685 [Wolbachia endosymbiont of Atemnus politus]|uniref:hypothetical protein n=1 Tax=Wolbachia endosymbiont of Atemnus politus TaxID=2682840 RepID=UPI00157492A4|nr:hypothetical protein [Wolbachia endosymbiont of Atemnus politus]NSM56852.1 hypothetical protein [Wolbachia endosymbiont of Atemnus politus]